MTTSVNVNYGSKIANTTSYIKRFQNSLNYPIRNANLAIFVKATPPYPSLGYYNIKSFNNFDRTTLASSLTK